MTASPRHELWQRVRWPALGLVLAMAYGVAGYMILEGWRFMDALYMTVITLTTVGFREVRPLDDRLRHYGRKLLQPGDRPISEHVRRALLLR